MVGTLMIYILLPETACHFRLNYRVDHQSIGFVQICSNGDVTTAYMTAIAAFLKIGFQVIVLTEPRVVLN